MRSSLRKTVMGNAYVFVWTPVPGCPKLPEAIPYRQCVLCRQCLHTDTSERCPYDIGRQCVYVRRGDLRSPVIAAGNSMSAVPARPLRHGFAKGKAKFPSSRSDTAIVSHCISSTIQSGYALLGCHLNCQLSIVNSKEEHLPKQVFFLVS